jgi:hypothetical protein
MVKSERTLWVTLTTMEVRLDSNSSMNSDVHEGVGVESNVGKSSTCTDTNDVAFLIVKASKTNREYCTIEARAMT